MAKELFKNESQFYTGFWDKKKDPDTFRFWHFLALKSYKVPSNSDPVMFHEILTLYGSDTIRIGPKKDSDNFVLLMEMSPRWARPISLTAWVNLTHKTSLAIMEPTLFYDIKDRLKKYEKVPQDHFRSFWNECLQESKQRPLPHRLGNHHIFPQAAHCKLWACFFGWELEDTRRNAKSDQHSLINLRIVHKS